MEYINEMLEFKEIINELKEYTVTQSAKDKFEVLKPFLKEQDIKVRTKETSEARIILDKVGTPPAVSLDGIDHMLESAQIGELLSVDQLEIIGRFAASLVRLKSFLKRGEYLGLELCSYGHGIDTLEELREEIDKSIRNGRVDDQASKALGDTRRKMERISSSIRSKLESMLKNNKKYFSESFISNRNGHFTLPVKKEYKHQVSGSVIDQSSTGSTYFIEPTSVSKSKDELELLAIQEDNEVRKILYTLTALVEDFAPVIKTNIDYIEDLDYIFAKGKLSVKLSAVPATVTTDRSISIVNGRHPLLTPEECVPLNFQIGNGLRGVVITGPNTGGKTVALKTVGLLSVMAACGLHVPCEEARICMNSQVLCDIGDGQSITENLSTFSSHIRNVIHIIKQMDSETLILLDELGSGTDPAEGMGIAISILEELRASGCLFVATTHYPEVKEYADQTEGVINARMAFDKESLKPLYSLEIGEAGESCAFYIAKRLGMPRQMLERAYTATYKKEDHAAKAMILEGAEEFVPQKRASVIEKVVKPKTVSEEMYRFEIGDSVMVLPDKKLGIVFETSDSRGNVGVQVQKKKDYYNHKRVELKAKAKDLYPDDYDFSIIFDPVEVRKARHIMERKYDQNVEIRLDGK